MANPMDLYNKIKQYGDKAKSEADAFMKSLSSKYTPDKPAPDIEMEKGLQGILAKYQPRSSGNMIGLIGGIVSLVAFAVSPPLGIAALAAAAYTMYKDSSKSEHNH